jgi:hypothetical protein
MELFMKAFPPALGALLLCGPLALASAQEESAGPRYSGSMGTLTLGQQQFYRISFRPDIPLGRWGLALDLELFIDNKGGLSARGWKFGTATETFDSFLRKIYYVRYGRPRDPAYFKVGALDEVTLGYGLIMADYRNTLQYPGLKKTGIQFRFRDLGGSGLGLEGMVNNFQDFEEGGALIGLRLSGPAVGRLELGLTYVIDLDQYSGLVDSDDDGFPDAVDAFPGDEKRALDNDRDGVPDDLDGDDDNDGAIDVDPESGLEPSLAAALLGLNAEYGSAFPVDGRVDRKKPFNKDRVGRDPFAVLGLDAAYPLAGRPALELKLYGQLALLLDDDDRLDPAQAQSQGVRPGNRRARGLGLAAPGLWLSTGPFNGQVEFRHFRDDFDARYFDELYELDRARLDVATGQVRPKDALLGRGQALSGIFGRLGAELGAQLYASASYQYLTGADDPKQQLIASARLAERLLEQIPRLSQARAYYQKNNIGARLNERGTGQDGFFESTEDTFYGYVLGLEVSGGVSVLWDTRFVFERGADLQLERRKIMTIETVFVF